MNFAIAQRSIARSPIEETRRLLMRLNPSLFHGIACALMVEAAAAADPAGMPSLVRRQRELRVQELADYGAALWPELDWTGVGRAVAERGLLAPALQDDAVRAAAGWGSLLYLALARLADDPRLARCLRELAGRPASALHASPFAALRGLITGWRGLRRLARPLRLVHAAVENGWCESRPLPALAWEAAVQRFVAACAPSGVRGRLLALAVMAGLRSGAENHPVTRAVPRPLPTRAALPGVAALR
jgi:hypothetical protein